MTDNKKTKKTQKQLPSDCWSVVMSFLANGKDALSLMTTNNTLYNYVVTSNGFMLKNTTFWVKIRDVCETSQLWKRLWKVVIIAQISDDDHSHDIKTPGLDKRYKCGKCGCTYYKQLSGYSLSDDLFSSMWLGKPPNRCDKCKPKPSMIPVPCR